MGHSPGPPPSTCTVTVPSAWGHPWWDTQGLGTPTGGVGTPGAIVTVLSIKCHCRCHLVGVVCGDSAGGTPGTSLGSGPSFRGQNPFGGASQNPLFGVRATCLGSEPSFWPHNPILGGQNPIFGSGTLLLGSEPPFLGSELPFWVQNPLFWDQNPLFGVQNSLFGVQNPLFGPGTPFFRLKTPIFGVRTPIFGVRTLISGVSGPSPVRPRTFP